MCCITPWVGHKISKIIGMEEIGNLRAVRKCLIDDSTCNDYSGTNKSDAFRAINASKILFLFIWLSVNNQFILNMPI